MTKLNPLLSELWFGGEPKAGRVFSFHQIDPDFPVCSCDTEPNHTEELDDGC